MHVYVKISRLETRVLCIGEFSAGGGRPGIIGSFGKRYDYGTIFGAAHLSGGAIVNVCGDSFDSSCGNAAAHTFVCGNNERTATGCRGFNGRHLLIAGQFDFYFATATAFACCRRTTAKNQQSDGKSRRDRCAERMRFIHLSVSLYMLLFELTNSTAFIYFFDFVE